METFCDAVHLRLGLSGWTCHRCLLCTSRTKKPTNFTIRCINECFDWHTVHSLSDKEVWERLDMEQIVSDGYHLARLHGNLQHVLDAAEEFLFCSYQDSDIGPDDNDDNDQPAPQGQPSDISKQLMSRGHQALKFLHKSDSDNQSGGNWTVFSGLHLSNQPKNNLMHNKLYTKWNQHHKRPSPKESSFNFRPCMPVLFSRCTHTSCSLQTPTARALMQKQGCWDIRNGQPP
ncbi:hypothetical protein BC830DRAFT_1129329 [Chytriomyces sp. MP71]|nr:hypothetical protein BC830DRAFT_1129329 [Chytriomyces sp. MP71]